MRKPLRKYVYDDLHNNNDIFSLTRKLAIEKKDMPVIVYSHLMMPHYPYYFDSKGEPRPFETLIDTGHLNKTNFLEYLLFTNQKLLELIDGIQSSSANPPVIILMSDHGFRYFKNQDPAYLFMTLNAVYFPNRNYTQFYEGMTNVNQFRVILNSLLGQKLPLLKDSTIHIIAE
jgi:hypothetical protein